MSSSSSAEETFPVIGADDLVKLKGPNGEDVYGVITATGWDSEEEEGQDDDEQLGDDELRELLAQYGISDLSQIDDLTEEEGEGDNKQRVLRLNQDTKDKLAKTGAAPTAAAGAPKGAFGAFGAAAGGDDDDDDDEDGEGGEEDLGGVDDDFGQRPKLGPNEVVVQILGGGDVILPADKVTLVDKSLCPGDVVLSRRDPTNQSGVVQSVKTFLDIYVPAKNQVLHAVPSRLVKFLHAAPFLYVVEKQKIGRVEEYVDRARIRFSNGMECWIVLTSLQGEELEISDVASAYLMNPETDFVPGQQVTVSLDTLKNAEWIGSSRFTAKQFNTHSRRQGVIKEIQLEGAVVEWLFSNNEEEPIEDEEDPEGPPIVDMKKVFKLTHYDNTKWLVGNRVYLKAGAFSRGGERHKKEGEVRVELYDDINDVAPVSSKPPRSAAASAASSKPARGGRGGRGKAPAPRGGTTIASKPVASDDDIIFGSVIRTTSFVEVKWQDNTVTDNIRTTDLFDNSTVIDTDFWPEDFVQPLDKDNYHIKSKFPEGAEIAGVVRKCDSINRQVLVDWFAVGSDPQKDFHIQELVSAYEVVQKDDFNFNLSSIVRKASEDASAMEEYPDWVGEVIALDRGHISVRWADGSKTTVLPHQILLIDLDGEDDGPGDDDEDFDGEITPIGEQFEPGTIEEIDEEGHTATGGVKSEEDKKKDDSDSKAKVAALEEEEAGQLKEITKSLSELKIEEAKPIDFAYGKFPRIQVVDATPSNFKFAEESAHRPFELAQKIQKDLLKLTADMPDRTFIHLFQDSLFNLQILIIGTDGTPFFDVPFVFDLQAGPEFFSEGPRISFRTDALGPILPVVGLDGTICIDQLISEVEDDEDDKDAKKEGDEEDDGEKGPLYGDSEPSIYDLVIYIQGIMLGTSTPYTLEPSVERYHGSSISKVNGALYNEVSVVHSLEHVIRTVAKNDTSFADVIKAHLAERIPKIIERVQAFIKWHEEVVKPNPDSLKSTTIFTENPLGIPLRATAGFVQSLTALLPRLEAAAASAAAPASE